MPVLDGIGATRLIRHMGMSSPKIKTRSLEAGGISSLSSPPSQSRAPQRRVMIVGLTGNSLESKISECLTNGMDMVMTKPYDRKKLIEVINRFMDKGVIMRL